MTAAELREALEHSGRSHRHATIIFNAARTIALPILEEDAAVFSRILVALRPFMPIEQLNGADHIRGGVEVRKAAHAVLAALTEGVSV